MDEAKLPCQLTSESRISFRELKSPFHVKLRKHIASIKTETINKASVILEGPESHILILSCTQELVMNCFTDLNHMNHTFHSHRLCFRES